METRYSSFLSVIPLYWYNHIGLVLLAITIAFSPSFSIGTIPGGEVIEIRLEDIVLLLAGLLWLFTLLLSGTKRLARPPLFVPILLWLGFGLFTTLFNSLLGNVQIVESIFFFLKETEYFLFYFYVWYHVQTIDTAKQISTLWILLGALNASWILIQLVSNIQITFYYGPTLFAEPNNPFGSGIFFLIIFIFFFNLFLYYYSRLALPYAKKALLAGGIFMLTVGIFSSGSQTSFIGLVFALMVTFLLYLAKTKLRNPAFLFISFITIAFGALTLLTFNSYPLIRQLSLEKVLWELSLSQSPDPSLGSTRVDIWKSYLDQGFSSYLSPFIGRGKSAVGEAHSQYIRNFVETGIIGSLLFLILIISLLKRAGSHFLKERDPFRVGIASALLTLTLTMLLISVPAETFIYGAKLSEAYWYLTGIAMAVFSFTTVPYVNRAKSA